MTQGGTAELRDSWHHTVDVTHFKTAQFDFIKSTFLRGKSSRNPPKAFLHPCISLSLSSFVRNADKLSTHTKCSSDPIGWSVPMWLLLSNGSAGTFGAVWGWSVAPYIAAATGCHGNAHGHYHSISVCLGGGFNVNLTVGWMSTQSVSKKHLDSIKMCAFEVKKKTSWECVVYWSQISAKISTFCCINRSCRLRQLLLTAQQQ